MKIPGYHWVNCENLTYILKSSKYSQVDSTRFLWNWEERKTSKTRSFVWIPMSPLLPKPLGRGRHLKVYSLEMVKQRVSELENQVHPR